MCGPRGPSMKAKLSHCDYGSDQTENNCHAMEHTYALYKMDN